MKTLKLFLFASILSYTTASFAQSSNNEATSEFCGQKFVLPANCEVIGNMIRCADYVFTWAYEPIADLPRHQKELLAQAQNPQAINVSVINTDLVGYLSKVETFSTLLIIGEVNKQGVIINLFLNGPIKSSADLPEPVRQFISIK